MSPMPKSSTMMSTKLGLMSWSPRVRFWLERTKMSRPKTHQPHLHTQSVWIYFIHILLKMCRMWNMRMTHIPHIHHDHRDVNEVLQSSSWDIKHMYEDVWRVKPLQDFITSPQLQLYSLFTMTSHMIDTRTAVFPVKLS